MNKKNIKLYLKNNKLIIALVLIIITLAFVCTSLGKYKTTIDIATIDLTINPKLQEYDITGSSKTLLKESLRGSSLSEVGADKIYGKESENFKLDGENGLYLNDTSDTTNYWLFFYFVADDGYSTTLNTSHYYYLRTEIKMTYKVNASVFALSFANFKHNGMGDYGANTMGLYFNQLSEDYMPISVYGKIRKHADRVVGEKTYVGDYPDAIQIGSSTADMSEFYIKNLMLLDLTEIFGEGNEPTKAWCDANIKFDTTTITWFAEKEQSRINSIPESYYPYAVSASTLSLRSPGVISYDDNILNNEYELLNMEDVKTNFANNNEINNTENNINENITNSIEKNSNENTTTTSTNTSTNIFSNNTTSNSTTNEKGENESGNKNTTQNEIYSNNIITENTVTNSIITNTQSTNSTTENLQFTNTSTDTDSEKQAVEEGQQEENEILNKI